VAVGHRAHSIGEVFDRSWSAVGAQLFTPCEESSGRTLIASPSDITRGHWWANPPISSSSWSCSPFSLLPVGVDGRAAPTAAPAQAKVDANGDRPATSRYDSVKDWASRAWRDGG
jgi:hypothetical protein